MQSVFVQNCKCTDVYATSIIPFYYSFMVYNKLKLVGFGFSHIWILLNHYVNYVNANYRKL
jgi:hypothetical protein